MYPYIIYVLCVHIIHTYSLNLKALQSAAFVIVFISQTFMGSHKSSLKILMKELYNRFSFIFLNKVNTLFRPVITVN